MNPAAQAVILLRIALGSSLGATPFVTNAIRVAVVVGLAYSDPGKVYEASQKWNDASRQLDAVTGGMNVAWMKAKSGWNAEDADAYSNAQIQYAKEVGDLKAFCSNVSTVLQTIAMAYVAFAVTAAGVAAFVLACAITVALSAATPAFPAVKGAAETAAGAVALVAETAGKTLAGVTAAAKAILLAGVGLYLAAKYQKPGGDNGVDFTQVKIDYHAPKYDSDPEKNGYVAPKKNLPESAR